jgi:LysM repeat protein
VRRPQNPVQQVLVGVMLLAGIAATLLCGSVFAFGDRLRTEGDLTDGPTATVYKIATLADNNGTSEPTKIAEATVIIIPTTTRVPTRVGASPTPTETPTATATVQPSATAQVVTCNPRVSWVFYRVQSGETLFQIGLRYDLTVDEMMDANCLTTERINAGDLLRVPPTSPRATAVPTRFPTATAGGPALPTPRIGPTGTQSTTDGSCTNSDSFIASPDVGDELKGNVAIRGTANVPNFAFYKLEIRREGASTAQDYVTFFTGQEPVINGVLATLNTANYPDGEYWVRLVVVDSTGNYPERCAILYPFNNN